MPERAYILAIDQGTTGSRAFIFDAKGKVVSSAYKEFTQHFPRPGWVEHDAEEIWSSCVSVIRKAVRSAKINSGRISAIGITNQRETTVLWNRKTGKPVGKAIVWQCRRTTDLCARLKRQGHEKAFHKKTGLVLDPYFSGTKVRWILDNVKGIRKKAASGQICFGTVDSWLIYKLTGGAAHVTDHTNASRTLLYNIRSHDWDKGLLKILKVPGKILPSVQDSGSVFGHTVKGVAGLKEGIPITGVLGDQQAALYGQGCYDAGSFKNTYGTGSFIVMNTGKECVYSKKGLLTTIAADDKGKPVYALEGAIFITGAVMQWLRDQLKLFKDASQSETLIKGLEDNGGVYIVPAFTGLGAPYWDSDARGVICGLTRGANDKHVIRAALESMAYQTKDVVDVMRTDLGKRLRTMKVDGGACRNDFLMQFQADILGCSIERPKMIDSTVFGAALLAGRTAGIFKNKKDLRRLHRTDKVFRSKMSATDRKQLYAGWQDAVQRARSV